MASVGPQRHREEIYMYMVNISIIISKINKILWHKLNFIYFCFHLAQYDAFYKLSTSRDKGLAVFELIY